MTTDRLLSLVPLTSPSRRRFAGLVGGTGVLLLSGCGGGGGGGSAALAPSIVTQPQSLSVAAGGSVTLRVEATGADLQFQWFRNATPISGATTSSLQVVASEADNGARYAVSVRNAAGEARSVDAVLTVTAALVPGISLIAGGIGGPGYLLGRGTQARLTSPRSLAIGKAGAVYFRCGGLGVFKASADGDVQFFTSFPFSVSDWYNSCYMACDSQGVLHVGIEREPGGGAIYKLLEDGASPRWVLFAGNDQLGGFADGVGISARISYPTHLVFDKSDNLYFIDRNNTAIRKLAPSGQVTTLAGRPNQPVGDGVGAAAGFANPQAMTLLPDGNLVVMDSYLWRKVSPAGVVSFVAGAPRKDIRSFCVGSDGSLFALEGGILMRVAEDGTTTMIAGGANTSAADDSVGANVRFDSDSSIAVAPDGSVLIADTANHMVRRVSVLTGQVTTWLGSAAKTGDVDGQGSSARFGSSGYSVNSTSLSQDASGNMYVFTGKLRKVTPAGLVTTIPNVPTGGVVDAQGNYHIIRNRAIYRVTPEGAQTLWAGHPELVGYADGVAGNARFAQPASLVFDRQGNLLVVDYPYAYVPAPFYMPISMYGRTIRKIAPDQTVTTIWGTPGLVIDPRDAANDKPDPTRGMDFWSAIIGVDDSEQIWLLAQKSPDSAFTTSLLLTRVSGANQERISIPLPDHRGDGYCFGPEGAVYVSLIGASVTGGTTIYKWSSSEMALKPLAGQSGDFTDGLRLGALPGSFPKGISILPQRDNTLICFSENALLKVRLS